MGALVRIADNLKLDPNSGLIIDPCFPNSPNPASIAAGTIVIFPDIGPVRGSESQPNFRSQFAIPFAPDAALEY